MKKRTRSTSQAKTKLEERIQMTMERSGGKRAQNDKKKKKIELTKTRRGKNWGTRKSGSQKKKKKKNINTKNPVYCMGGGKKKDVDGMGSKGG